MPVTTAIFDAFGTLLQIRAGKILRLGIEQGRCPEANDAEVLMSAPMDLREAAVFLASGSSLLLWTSLRPIFTMNCAASTLISMA